MDSRSSTRWSKQVRRLPAGRLLVILPTIALAALMPGSARAVSATYTPTNVEVRRTGVTEVEVSWTDTVPDGSAWRLVLERNTIEDPNLVWNVADEVGGEASSAIDDDAVSPERLKWRVCVRAPLDPIPACSVEVVMPPTPSPSPPNVHSVTPIPGQPAVVLEWGASVSSVRYEVRVRQDGAPPLEIATDEDPIVVHFGYETPNTYPPSGHTIAIDICAVSAIDVRACAYRAFQRNTDRPSAAPSVSLLNSTLSDRVTLLWTHASDDATKFAIWRRGGGRWNLRGTTTDLQYTDEGVTPGSKQKYRVCATNAGGSTCTGTLLVRVPQTRPTVPVDLRAEAVPNWIDRARISWQRYAPMDPPVSMLQILRQATGEADMLLYAPSTYDGFVDVDLVPGRLYRYYVRAANEAGWGPYGTTAIELPIPLPNPPAGLTAVGEDAANIHLQWTPPASFPPVVSIRVDRLMTYGTYVPIGLADPDADGYSDQWLAPNTRYDYRACSRNSFGERCSNTAGANTLAPEPGAPTLDKPSLSSNSLTLTWQPTLTEQTGFVLQRQESGVWSDATSILPPTTLTATIAGLSPGTHHRLRVCALYASVPMACSPAATLKTAD